MATHISDGTVANIQAIHDAETTLPGDVITIPASPTPYTWTSAVSLTKGVHLRGDGATTTTIRSARTTDGVSLYMTKHATHYARVSGLKFVPYATASDPSKTFHIEVGGSLSAKPFMIHDCIFESVGVWCGYAILIAVNGGIIWNNTFTSDNIYLCGISIVIPEATENAWTAASIMGDADTNGTNNVYIEDNTFTRGSDAAINPDDNSRVVIRNNQFNTATISPHGADTSDFGVRHMEVYDNVFDWDGDIDTGSFVNRWLYIRGGTGLVTGNYLPDIPFKEDGIQFIVQQIRRNGGPYSCWTGGYPVPRQVGQSHNGTTTITEPYYVWDNTGTETAVGIRDYQPDQCGNGLSSVDYIQVGRDYKLEAKPGWTRYTYPHPLRRPVYRTGKLKAAALRR